MAGRRGLDRRAHVPTRGARERMRRRIANSGRLVGGWLDLAIDAEGSLVGEIDARHPPRAMPPGVFELGIALFDEEARGRGYGTEAIALLTAHLFAELGAERVQASTAVDKDFDVPPDPRFVAVEPDRLLPREELIETGAFHVRRVGHRSVVLVGSNHYAVQRDLEDAAGAGAQRHLGQFRAERR